MPKQPEIENIKQAFWKKLKNEACNRGISEGLIPLIYDSFCYRLPEWTKLASPEKEFDEWFEGISNALGCSENKDENFSNTTDETKDLKDAEQHFDRPPDGLVDEFTFIDFLNIAKTKKLDLYAILKLLIEIKDTIDISPENSEFKNFIDDLICDLKMQCGEKWIKEKA